MLSWEQGQESVVVHATRASDDKPVVMKRPSYGAARVWDDTLSMECFIHNYLNSMGVPNIPKCVAESFMSKEEVLRAGLAENATFERANDGTGKWHAIFIEKGSGSTVPVDNGRLGDRTPPEWQDAAVSNILQTTWRMLCAGIVNGDQWHNILLGGRGEATFIDFGAAGFLDERPLDVAKEAGISLGHRVQHFEGQKYVTKTQTLEVLSEEAAEQQVRAMIGTIFRTIGQPAAVYKGVKSRPKLGEGDCGGDSARMRKLGPRLHAAVSDEHLKFTKSHR